MAPKESEKKLAFRQVIRERILKEMIASTRVGTSDYKVLLTDSVTLKVISSTCKMADVTDEGVSLVEDISKRRQPMPTMEALYFIQPTDSSFAQFKRDMEGRGPLYKKAHIYLSRPIPDKNMLAGIKSDPSVLGRIAGLKEANLEFNTVDIQGFVTSHDDAMHRLFREQLDQNDYEILIGDIATRLATVFASLKEFPAVRYKAAKASTPPGSKQRLREMVPMKLAAALWERLSKYKEALPGFPTSDTCDLVILDRSIDPIAPVIHDWSYGGLCFDLLAIKNNKYDYVAGGEKKVAVLDEHDPIWKELRDLFLADAYTKVTEIVKQLNERTGGGGELSGREMAQLVQSLGSYRDQKEKVDLHVKMSVQLKERTAAEALFDIGRLEQGFVFGDSTATYKQLANVINEHPDMSVENKMRLLAVYAAVNPDKLDPQKQNLWMKLAKLDAADMQAVTNLEFLGVRINKDFASGISLTFGARKDSAHVRKTKSSEEEYELSRFYPVIQDILEDCHRLKLSTTDYPYVQEPTNAATNPISASLNAISAPLSKLKLGTTSNSGPVSSSSSEKKESLSVRKKKPPVRREQPNLSGSLPVPVGGILGAASGQLTSWATRGATGLSSALGMPENKRRLIVFIVGGMTRSEIRVAHLLSKELNREVIIGSTSLDTPMEFIEKLRSLRS